MMITADVPARVAYAIDNRQPVRCTLIGDQPLFYMDFETAVEADSLDDGFSFAAIEKSLQDLREKISQLDALNPSGGMTEDAVSRFCADADGLCRPSGAPDAATAATSVKMLEALLRRSRFAAALLDLGANFGPVLHYSRQQAGAFYDRRGGAIAVHPDLPLADQALLAARELRRLWQHRNGALIHPLAFHPDQAILINRAQVADLAVATARIAWELQLAGEKDVWFRLEGSSLGDIARAFAREALADFRTLNNGAAAAAAFETWFLSDRCRTEDRRLIQQMLADYNGYVFGDADMSRTVSGELIVALGSMPFGKNYLLPYAQTVVKDAVFTEVRDRSNANFLWFIKFERSFREAEAENAPAGLDAPRNVTKNAESGGEIVAFPVARPDGQYRAVSAMPGGGSRRGGQVVNFRPSPGPAAG